MVTSVKAGEAVHLGYGCFTVWTRYPRKLLEATSFWTLPVGSDERLRLTANDMDSAGPPSSPEGWSFFLA